MNRAFGFLLLVMLVGGCAAGGPEEVRRVEQADTLILYSLDCGTMCGRDQPKPGAETLHGYEVLGKVTLSAEQRAKVAAAVRQAIVNPGVPPSTCYWPRHAVRAMKDGAVTADVVVCFYCNTYGYYPDGGDTHAPTPAFGGSAKPLFNDILTAAGVPLCPEK